MKSKSNSHKGNIWKRYHWYYHCSIGPRCEAKGTYWEWTHQEYEEGICKEWKGPTIEVTDKNLHINIALGNIYNGNNARDKILKARVGKFDQQVEVLSIKPDDLSSIPRT